jgi:diadenosine tetraphosphatase ApaH/serine/threonine PP2A family protein phosphatase
MNLSGLAVISDIHSNLEALTAVLADIKAQGLTQIVCLGDIVGYAASPHECLEVIRQLDCPVVLGNHDEAASIESTSLEELNGMAATGILYSREHLTAADKDWLSKRPRAITKDDIQFTHASLEDLSLWPYVIHAEDAHFHFRQQTTRLGFCGHSHYPGVWIEISSQRISEQDGVGTMELPRKRKVLVNVGSVGQPRDRDPRACYVVYRSEPHSIEFRRVDYEIEKAQDKIRKARLPRLVAARLAKGE